MEHGREIKNKLNIRDIVWGDDIVSLSWLGEKLKKFVSEGAECIGMRSKRTENCVNVKI